MAYKKGDFAKGLKEFNTKGAMVTKVRLTKGAGRFLLDIAKEQRENISLKFPEEGSQAEHDFQVAVQFIINEVSKRWSQSQLYSE